MSSKQHFTDIFTAWHNNDVREKEKKKHSVEYFLLGACEKVIDIDAVSVLTLRYDNSHVVVHSIKCIV